MSLHRTVGDADSGYLLVKCRDGDSNSDLPMLLSLADWSPHEIASPSSWCRGGRYVEAAVVDLGPAITGDSAEAYRSARRSSSRTASPSWATGRRREAAG